MDFIHRAVYIIKHNVSDTGSCLRLQVKPTQLGQTDRASPYPRMVIWIKIGRWVMSRNIVFVLLYHRHKLSHLNHES
jgi:hypothetical protein